MHFWEKRWDCSRDPEAKRTAQWLFPEAKKVNDPTEREALLRQTIVVSPARQGSLEFDRRFVVQLRVVEAVVALVLLIARFPNSPRRTSLAEVSGFRFQRVTWTRLPQQNRKAGMVLRPRGQESGCHGPPRDCFESRQD